MNYCGECGNRLIMRDHGIDGDIPYCTDCRKFRYPPFNSAVSAIILNPHKDKILLIQQYGKTNNVLVAGYIAKGENARQALVREINEETGLEVKEYIYNDNEYYEKTNTLVHNYVVVSTGEKLTLNSEVDRADWFELSEVHGTVASQTSSGYFLKKAFKDIIYNLDTQKFYQF